MGAHTAVAVELLGDQAHVQAILDDDPSAPIGEQERALFAFVRKVARQPNQITQDDVDAATAAGWSDEALYDAITVCALFAFYNTWNDAAGVPGEPAVCALSGRMLAQHGYVSSEDAQPPS
jgi:alkylhydroperoxidase family enzyme